mmetsp:Transcript_13188/g.24454  ORF Transcript_13188/g.24454 Transcript_13188/m.24454 type:complete len:342 (+) Transcript_13188:196-1221(+)
MQTIGEETEQKEMALRRVGVCFDIDGVLLRGKKMLPGAKEAVQLLRKRNIPHIFLTNGGGIKETTKADVVGKVLGLKINHQDIVLAHTPMKSLVHKRGLGDKRVMILGCKNFEEVADSYGFKRTVTPQEFVAQHPDIYPFLAERAPQKESHDPYKDEPIEAILVVHDPVDWHLEIQVCIDVLLNRDPLSVARGLKQGEKPIPVYNSNEDFVFASTYDHPRFAQGAFVETLSHLYKLSGGDQLEIERFGKPNKVTFDYAENLLEAKEAGPKKNAPAGSTLDRIFMIGDNPAADIEGANKAGGAWRSVLLESGIYKDGDDTNGAHHVLPDVLTAIEAITKDQM